MVLMDPATAAKGLEDLPRRFFLAGMEDVCSRAICRTRQDNAAVELEEETQGWPMSAITTSDERACSSRRRETAFYGARRRTPTSTTRTHAYVKEISAGAFKRRDQKAGISWRTGSGPTAEPEKKKRPPTMRDPAMSGQKHAARMRVFSSVHTGRRQPKSYGAVNPFVVRTVLSHMKFGDGNGKRPSCPRQGRVC